MAGGASLTYEHPSIKKIKDKGEILINDTIFKEIDTQNKLDRMAYQSPIQIIKGRHRGSLSAVKQLSGPNKDLDRFIDRTSSPVKRSN